MELAGIKIWVDIEDGAGAAGWAVFVNLCKGRKFTVEAPTDEVNWAHSSPEEVTVDGDVAKFELAPHFRGGPGFLSPCGDFYLLSNLLDEIKEEQLIQRWQDAGLNSDGTYWAADYLCMAEQLLAERAL